ncbi:cyclic AMP-responsive element-binding protein 3-like protein 1 isoform X3 [Apus apus]|uniref:cyclic AMP-responsive element-binding protein 3-like protein 1 isoform X3 n=1 Tax=Apus apus TaxID=8895 RepID=UPI0021F88E5B|nr:cyclic AMP-responsive element-binding protein 3-like protein 1 isoform X3 [Apus apus]
MDSILEPFPAERLFPAAGSGFLDLGDFSEADFLSNVHFSENLDHFSDNMEDFSNDLFSSFFDDPVLAEKNPLLDMDLDPPTPGIQAEHSYSLSGDSAPQSPLVPVKAEDNANELENGVWSLGPKLCSIMVKQEQNLALDLPESQLAASSIPVLNLNPLQRLPVPEETPIEMTPAPVIKAEPKEVNQFLNVPAVDDLVQMPPTPPSSHGSDSDGSQSPRSLPPSSPARPAARSSAAISSSPLLTAPHKLQGTSGPLLLTEEEKRTLIAEGYPIPTKLPLTKAEEKALKRVRRKIKNKISAQESRRKKKEYVECLEKKVETYTTENNELWKKVETLENANRTLLQQLQKLQALVAGKVSRPYKMASTQTGTCLMVLALCFVLILGSLMPCLPEFSSASQTVKATPAPDIYTTIQSRSLLFYDEGAGSLEESYSSFLTMDHPEGWEAEKGQSEDGGPHLARTHETAKYLSKSQLEGSDQNQTDPTLTHLKEQFHERAAAGSVHRHLPPSPAWLLLPGTPRDVPGAGETLQKVLRTLLPLLGAPPSLDALSPENSPAGAAFPTASPLPLQCRLLRQAARRSPGFHQLFLCFAVAGQWRQRKLSCST